jgi:hypothetical protein
MMTESIQIVFYVTNHASLVLKVLNLIAPLVFPTYTQIHLHNNVFYNVTN